MLGSVPQADLSNGLDVVGEAWNIIFREYVDKDKLDAGELSKAAIMGMVEALDDPYTTYVDVETRELMSSNLEGKLEGIGAQVGIRDGQLMIIVPIPDTPAARTGLKAGDIILEIDGQPAAEMSLNEAVLKIRGPTGTPVTLLILHEGETTPEKFEIIRDEIKVSSVSREMRGDIALITISYFSERTDTELAPVLEDIKQRGATGIILDLRSNPGGILQTVIDVAGHFIKEGVVVDVVDNNGQHSPAMVAAGEVTTDLPMVVLVDSYSASGSEVLAGALRDHGRAVLAGSKTFGKGSVNVPHRLSDGSGLYITVARWLTPNGDLIEGEGLTPDIELELTGEEAIEWAIDYLPDKSCPVSLVQPALFAFGC